MALLKYLKKGASGQDVLLPDQKVCPTLSSKELKSAGDKVKEQLESSSMDKKVRGKYNSYDAERRAEIGKYAAENRPTRASRHFIIPEPTARRMKIEYLHKLEETK